MADQVVIEPASEPERVIHEHRHVHLVHVVVEYRIPLWQRVALLEEQRRANRYAGLRAILAARRGW